VRSRASGILLHPTSLPDGHIGRDAHRFVDWLARAGQSWWQVLPIGPPDELGSPYQPRSAFAAWPGLLERPGARVSRSQVDSFRERHRYWAPDWARFAGDGALEDQVRFEREWDALRTHAAERGVRLLGDVPIYAGGESADLAAHPGLFRRHEISGAPPDALAREGQVWGNPLFDWRAVRRDGFRWWIERLRRVFELVDAARIDHFRGFVSYWAVPAGARTASTGRWRRGPGRALFDAVSAALGDLPLVAENLGHITPAVERLRRELGFPGMHVLQFGFSGSPRNPHRPENHEENAVVYTGTHDLDTALGWWRSLPRSTRRRTGLDEDEPHWSLIELALHSRARLAVVPLQDVLGLGSEARMNVPGRARGNWRWRFDRTQLTPGLADRLRALVEETGRTNPACSAAEAGPA
jgi:4-alpha-glucanotransferase